jgi:hypothetical protein
VDTSPGRMPLMQTRPRSSVLQLILLLMPLPSLYDIELALSATSISSNKQEMVKMSDLVERLNGYVELYKPAFDSVMRQLNPALRGKFTDIDEDLNRPSL